MFGTIPWYPLERLAAALAPPLEGEVEHCASPVMAPRRSIVRACGDQLVLKDTRVSKTTLSSVINAHAIAPVRGELHPMVPLLLVVVGISLGSARTQVARGLVHCRPLPHCLYPLALLHPLPLQFLQLGARHEVGFF
jgi:hypothetical protein